MWLKNRKYPLAINQSLARKYHIPADIIRPGIEGGGHKYRILLINEGEEWVRNLNTILIYPAFRCNRRVAHGLILNGLQTVN